MAYIRKHVQFASSKTFNNDPTVIAHTNNKIFSLFSYIFFFCSFCLLSIQNEYIESLFIDGIKITKEYIEI